MIDLNITLRDIDQSPALEQRIKTRVAKLEQLFAKITSCHVVIEYSQNAKHQGKLLNVRVNVLVPGRELVANHHESEDIYVAIRDAFDSMQRSVEDYARERRGDVKNHAVPVSGEVVRLFSDKQFGFIKGGGGDEYYFNADNVVGNKFDRVKVGAKVHFTEAMGDDGLKAHHVRLERE